MFNGGFPVGPLPLLLRPLLLLSPRLRGDVGGSRGCWWRRWTRHLSFTLPPAEAGSPPLTSYLRPLLHLVAPSWQLPLSFSPLLLSLPFTVRHSPRTLSCSVPVCLLFLPPTPNVEQLYLSRSVARYSSAFSLFLSFSASILFAPSPRPASQAPCFSSRGKNRFPRVLSCVPGIVGNYSTQPAIPFSPFSLAVPMYVCLRFRLFCVARFQRRRRCP